MLPLPLFILIVFVFSLFSGNLSYHLMDNRYLSTSNFSALRTDEIIKFYGYPGEEHKVQTEDGYILTNFRMANPGGYPILLLHGLTAASDCWLVRGPPYDISFRLWRRNYDVWFLNVRGNIYSLEHVNMTYKEEDKFYKFTIEDYGRYDTAATIDYILKVTGHKSVITIGHSNGAGNILSLISLKPEYNAKIKLGVSWGQAVMMRNVIFNGPGDVFYGQYIYFYNFDNSQGAFNKGSLLYRVVKTICSPESPVLSQLCYFVIGMVSGPDSKQVVMSAVQKMMTKFPAGTSLNAFKQMVQNMRSGEFAPLSFGKKANLRKYGTELPPPYPMHRITVPIAIYYSNNDFLSSKQDNIILKSRLPNVVRMQEISYRKFNHGDFLWAKDAYRLLYKDVLTLIDQYTPDPYKCKIPIYDISVPGNITDQYTSQIYKSDSPDSK